MGMDMIWIWIIFYRSVYLSYPKSDQSFCKIPSKSDTQNLTNWLPFGIPSGTLLEAFAALLATPCTKHRKNKAFERVRSWTRFEPGCFLTFRLPWTKKTRIPCERGYKNNVFLTENGNTSILIAIQLFCDPK